MDAKINVETVSKGVKVETQYSGIVTVRTTDWAGERLWGVFGTREDGTTVRVPGEQVIRPLTCGVHLSTKRNDEGVCWRCEYEIAHDC